MSEVKINLKGWQAVVGLIIIVAVIAVRFATLNDMTKDKGLMKHIDTQLMMEHYPHMAEKMQAAYDTGDDDKIGEAVDSITSSRVNVESVKASYPLFDFSLPKKVVIKVEFSLDDDTGKGDKRIIYYLFTEGVFGWRYEYITSAVSYYLNFI